VHTVIRVTTISEAITSTGAGRLTAHTLRPRRPLSTMQPRSLDDMSLSLDHFAVVDFGNTAVKSDAQQIHVHDTHFLAPGDERLGAPIPTLENPATGDDGAVAATAAARALQAEVCCSDCPTCTHTPALWIARLCCSCPRRHAAPFSLSSLNTTWGIPAGHKSLPVHHHSTHVDVNSERYIQLALPRPVHS
jgi:hypothetical protein